MRVGTSYVIFTIAPLLPKKDFAVTVFANPQNRTH